VPPTFFGAVMGITGLAIAWRRAEEILGWPSVFGDLIFLIGAMVLILMLPTYAAKCILFPGAVRDDINHPIKSAFVGGLPLAICLQLPFISPYYPTAAQGIWLVTALSGLGLYMYIFSRWFLLENKIENINAVWFIPGCGSFIISMTGAPLGFVEMGWFYFSIAVTLWVFLSGALMYRYIFCPKLPDALVPTYFVNIVPPGLASMIYPMLAGGGLMDFLTGGEVAAFTRVTYFFALFWLVLCLAMFRMFLKLKFGLGWWAYSFPLDTITAATLMYGATTRNDHLLDLGGILLIASTVVIGGILLQTIYEITRGRVFNPAASN